MHTKQTISLRNTLGFTVIELLISLSILAVLFTWGLPSLDESIRNNRVSAQNNEILAMLYYAKSEAIRRNDQVTILLVSTSDGWTAVVEDPRHEADIEGCVTGQLRCSSNTQVGIDATSALLTFNNRGYIREADEPWTSEFIYLQHENCSGLHQRRRINIGPTGHIDSCHLACDDRDACPL